MDSRLLQALHTSLRLLLSTSLRLLYYVQEFYNYSAVLYKYNICIYAREEISTRVSRFTVCDLFIQASAECCLRYYSSHHGMLSPKYIQVHAGCCLRYNLDFILKYISSLDQAYISSAPEHAI